VQDPVARTTFLRIADEEQSQAEGISPCSGAGIRAQAENRAIRRMVSAFKEIEGSILKKIGTATDEIDALKIAMEMEMESIRLYAKLLPKIQAPGLKTLVWRLLREEQQRYTTIENTCLYLSDPAGWYLWNEQGITDGGTPWA
jgi:rubrerythrin